MFKQLNDDSKLSHFVVCCTIETVLNSFSASHFVLM